MKLNLPFALLLTLTTACSGDDGDDANVAPGPNDAGVSGDASEGTAPIVSGAGLCEVGNNVATAHTRGDDLLRVTLTDPQALCNDGTQGVFYVSPAPEGSPNAHKWIMWLEGGGACSNPKGCGDRWCGNRPTRSPYNPAKMSSRWAPEGIKGSGVFDRSPGNDAAANRFGDYNHVVGYYCSSDSWRGSTLRVAIDETGTYRTFSLHFQGAQILSSIFAALKAGASPDAGGAQMPSLDDATRVVLTGTSAGSTGVMGNADRIDGLLRATNPDVDFRVLLDAAIYPTEESEGLSAAKAAQIIATRQTIDAFRATIFDESCLAFHGEDGATPGEVAVCSDTVHVLTHHTSTRWFAKMDLTDGAAQPGYYDTLQQFTRGVFELLRSFEDLAAISEEPMAFQPGVFGPNCGHHQNVTQGVFYGIGITDRDGTEYSHHDVLWNWLEGQDPSYLVHAPDERFNSVCP